MDKDEKIAKLEKENDKLKKTIRELRTKVSRYQRRLNQDRRDNFEYIDFGRDG